MTSGSASLSGLASRVRAAGLRATGPRLAVLGALTKIGGHRTADEVLSAVRATTERTGGLAAADGVGGGLARASVYNALRDLTDAGVVLVADVGPGVARYEAGDVFHHHFVCRTCGGVTDVPCVVGARPCLTPDVTVAASIARLDEAQVVFKGVCATCVPFGAVR